MLSLQIVSPPFLLFSAAFSITGFEVPTHAYMGSATFATPAATNANVCLISSPRYPHPRPLPLSQTIEVRHNRSRPANHVVAPWFAANDGAVRHKRIGVDMLTKALLLPP